MIVIVGSVVASSVFKMKFVSRAREYDVFFFCVFVVCSVLFCVLFVFIVLFMYLYLLFVLYVIKMMLYASRRVVASATTRGANARYVS